MQLLSRSPSDFFRKVSSSCPVQGANLFWHLKALLLPEKAAVTPLLHSWQQVEEKGGDVNWGVQVSLPFPKFLPLCSDATGGNLGCYSLCLNQPLISWFGCHQPAKRHWHPTCWPEISDPGLLWLSLTLSRLLHTKALGALT